MASNSTQLGCANTSYKYTLSVNWSESETNIANNTTKISASGSLSASNVGFDALYDSYACHLKLYWHDNNKNTDTLFATSSAFKTCGMGYGTRSVSGSITVTHKSDGSLSGYVKVYFDAPTTSGGWSPGSSSCSTGWTTCTTIARASSISGLSGNQLNSGVSVTIDRKSSSFTHKVEYKFVNSGWTTVSSNTATSCSFTPPLSLASQIPSATSGALTVRVTTYNGSTQIGSSVTKSINLSVPSTVVPSISGLTATRIDNGVPSSWGIYVKGISQVKITASGASGSYGSTISGYSISGPGLYTNSSSGTSGQLSSTGTQTYTCTVTDSRGRKASKSVSITVVDYSYPSISISVERCKSDGTKDTSGTYLRVVINYEIASVSGKNSIASKSCSCNGVSNSSFASGTAFVLAANCSIGSHYAVNASIRDALGRTASASAEVSTAYRVLNVSKNKDGVAIGKFSEKAAFEVNMDSYFYGDIKSDVNIDESLIINKSASVHGNFYAQNGIYRLTDTRNVGTSPFDYRNVLKFLGLKTNSATGISDGGYQDIIGLCGWSDDSASGAHEIAFSRNAIYYRNETNNGGAWGSWNRIATQASVDTKLSKSDLTIKKWSKVFKPGDSGNCTLTLIKYGKVVFCSVDFTGTCKNPMKNQSVIPEEYRPPYKVRMYSPRLVSDSLSPSNGTSYTIFVSGSFTIHTNDTAYIERTASTAWVVN